MKIGIVGYGSIGQRHAANAMSLGHDVVVYDPAIRRDVRFERNIYESCDAVVIATPSPFHAGCMRACAERGRHMLVEKPISTSDHGLRELLDLAKKNNAVVMMGTNMRFHPCLQETKRWIDEGMIGKPLWAQFTCAALSAKAPYLSDGVILNTGSHEVDAALHLFGPAKVLCVTAHVGAYGDDIADFVLEHESGLRSSFHLDMITPIEIRKFWIAGTEKNIAVDLPLRHFAVGGVASQQQTGTYNDDYIAEMEAFIGRIEGKKVYGATGEDGLSVLRILLDVRKAARLQ